MTVLPDQLRCLVEDHPDEVAYRVVGNGELTFRQWDAGASRLAHGLIDGGLERGDRVALAIGPADALRFLVAYVAVHKAGGVNVPINTDFAAGEVARLLHHADPRVVVVSASLAERAVDLTAAAPGVELVVSTGVPTPGALAWQEVLVDEATDVQADIGEDDVADIIYTSGTTGAPKGVVSRHRNATAMPIGKPFWNGLHWFHASPLASIAGVTFVYVPMQLGMRTVYLPRFDPATFLDLAERGRVQTAFLVPAMVELLLAHPDVAARDLSQIQMVTVGSAPAAPARLLRLDDLLTNGAVVHSFALTESGSAHVVLPASELRNRPGSVGLPIPPTEVKVVDEGGAELTPGEVGEILLRNPGKEREYYRDPEATRRAWRGGWLHTGDLGWRDVDGYLYVAGRKKDIIIRGGQNVSAADVEMVLRDHPDIVEAVVVGLPHEVLGEEVAAVIVTRPDAKVTGEDLRDWCAGRLARYKVPRYLEFRPTLPRNPAGKVLKGHLRASLAGAVNSGAAKGPASTRDPLGGRMETVRGMPRKNRGSRPCEETS